MTPEMQEQFDNYFRMFESEGWKQLVSDLQVDINIQNQAFAIKDEAELNFRKGFMTAILNLINFEEGKKAQYDQLQEEGED